LHIVFEEEQHSSFTYNKYDVHNLSSYKSLGQYHQEIFIICSSLGVIWPTLISKQTKLLYKRPEFIMQIFLLTWSQLCFR